MAVADFNEFTWQRVHATQFEFAHGRELVEIGRDTNQSEEARTGADVIHLLRTRGGFRLHVMQYKRSHFASCGANFLHPGKSRISKLMPPTGIEPVHAV